MAEDARPLQPDAADGDDHAATQPSEQFDANEVPKDPDRRTPTDQVLLDQIIEEVLAENLPWRRKRPMG